MPEFFAVATRNASKGGSGGGVIIAGGSSAEAVWAGLEGWGVEKEIFG